MGGRFDRLLRRIRPCSTHSEDDSNREQSVVSGP